MNFFEGFYFGSDDFVGEGGEVVDEFTEELLGSFGVPRLADHGEFFESVFGDLFHDLLNKFFHREIRQFLHCFFAQPFGKLVHIDVLKKSLLQFFWIHRVVVIKLCC